MSEYATIEHYTNHVMDEITKRDVEQVSESLRALVWEEVVRCRDCKLWRDDCEWNRFFNDPEIDEPDGFCAWGERRGDA